MGFFDWLLTDPTQRDGGFLARMLLDHKAGDATAMAAPLPGSMSGSLLGESPLINLMRSGFAGMNAANGYSGFGPQFAAGVQGGADAMAQRRQQMIDQINALKLKQALQAKVGLTDGGGVTSPATDTAADAVKPCATCAGGSKTSVQQGASRSSPHFPVIVSSPQEAAKLAPGTWFRAPDGRVMQRGTVEVFNNG